MAAGKQMPTFDARAIFNHLDKNQDGKLSFEEFAAGLQRFHQLMAMRAPHVANARTGCKWFGTPATRCLPMAPQFAKSCFAEGPQHRALLPLLRRGHEGTAASWTRGLGQGWPGRPPLDRPPSASRWHGML